MKGHLIGFLPVLFILISCSRSLSHIYPGEIWPDKNGVHINAHGGGILFYENRYYWFGEHKIEGEKGNQAWVGVHCYSSAKLSEWKDEGIALAVSDSDSSLIAGGCILERPKVIYNPKSGKFVMWFHLEPAGMGYDGAMSGLAVSDRVTGPYTFIRAFRPNAGNWPVNVNDFHKKEVGPEVLSKYCGGKGCLPGHPDSLNLLGRDFKGGQMARDQGLFVDRDGTAYHIYSSEENSTLHISRLSDDYLSESGQFIRVFSDRYMEAPAMFRTDDYYYLIASDCTGWEPNAARLARATSVFGPWEELGNPFRGEESELSFRSQSTFVLEVQGKNNAFIYMGDRWNPKNAIDGRYIWLPVQFDEKGIPFLEWMPEWNTDFFE